MGKGHKERRRERRAREIEERDHDERLLKELQEDNEEKNQLFNNKNEEQTVNEKSIETCN